MSASGPPSDEWAPIPFDTGFVDHNGPLYIAIAPALEAGEPVRIGMRVAPRHCNQHGACHGGMIATFVDMALGMAARIFLKIDAPCPTMTMSIDFLGAAQCGDWLESRARFVNATYRTAACDVLVLGPKGPVARGSGLFKITRPK